MKTIYHIPAPDMDEKQIALVNAPNLNIVTLDLPTISAHTDLDILIDNLVNQIIEKKPTLLGFCYGGILAQEILKRLPGSTAIIVSSIVEHSEVPLKHRLLARMFVALPSELTRRLGTTVQFVVSDVLKVSVKIPRVWLKLDQNRFIIRHALSFERAEGGRIFRIHGSRDRVVPVLNVRVDRVIEGGGHFMFFQNKHKEVLVAIAEAHKYLNRWC